MWGGFLSVPLQIDHTKEILDMKSEIVLRQGEGAYDELLRSNRERMC
jgi:hypothetical protein